MVTKKTRPLAFLLEDDLSLVDIFDTCIQAAGFNTIIALDGKDAILQLETLVPDLFILDLHVPIIAGDEVIKFIRQSPRFDDVRIILATADARMAELLREQVDFVMDKPVSPRQLKQLIERLVPQIES